LSWGWRGCIFLDREPCAAGGVVLDPFGAFEHGRGRAAAALGFSRRTCRLTMTAAAVFILVRIVVADRRCCGTCHRPGEAVPDGLGVGDGIGRGLCRGRRARGGENFSLDFFAGIDAVGAQDRLAKTKGGVPSRERRCACCGDLRIGVGCCSMLLNSRAAAMNSGGEFHIEASSWV